MNGWRSKVNAEASTQVTGLSEWSDEYKKMTWHICYDIYSHQTSTQLSLTNTLYGLFFFIYHPSEYSYNIHIFISWYIVEEL